MQAVAPASTSNVELTFSTTNWTTTLTGTTPSWQTVRSRSVTSGRFIGQADEDGAADVVVLGPDTVTQLFGGRNPVGQSVVYQGTTLKVIGVLRALSSSEQTSNNDLAIVPLTTYQQRLVGGANRTSVSSIYVKATSSATLSAAYQETDGLLLNLHGITNAANADFSIATQESILKAATSVDHTLTLMLAGIAAISLLVGGIGVMNIMLVSVTERIREIGLRKALGARPRLIRRQFLVEASVLGLRRRAARRARRRARRGRDPEGERQPGGALVHRVGAGHRHGRGHRRGLRRLPGVPRRPPGPDRRPPERMR